MDRKVPNGWRSVRFGDVVREVKVATRDPESDGLTRVVGLEHLDSESLPLRRWNELADLGDGTSFTRVFRAGQVLFGKRRAYQRKVAVAGFDGICSSDILVFEPSTDDLLLQFLPYLAQSDGFFDHALGTSAGSLSPRTKFKELAKYEFALPPLDEQRRIVAVLSRSDLWRSATADVSERCQQLGDALVADLIASASGTVRLADRAEVLLGRQRHPRYASGEHMVQYVRAANVKDGYLDISSMYEMNFDLREQSIYRLTAGDVLVSEGCGNVDEVGANAVWNADIPGVICFQKALIRLRAISELTDSAFLGHWARHAFRSGLFKSIARGTNIWHISAERTRELPFPDLPLEVQRDAAQRLSGLGATAQLALTARLAGNRLHQQLSRSLLDGCA